MSYNLLEHLTETVTTSLLRNHVDHGHAKPLAAKIVHELATTFGGMQLYFPKPAVIDRAARDAEIYSLAGKMPIPELAQRYKLSMKQIWEIQRKQKTVHQKKISSTG